MASAEDLKKLGEKIRAKEDKRVSYDYYRNKMEGLEKTHKESQEPKKKERWEKNLSKQKEAVSAYEKACYELKDTVN